MELAVAIKAVVFDADGVVIHPWRFAGYLEREHGLTRAQTRPFFRGVFNDCLLGHADLREVLPPYLTTWGWPGTLDTFLERWFNEENAADPQVVRAIQLLRRRGFRCALATNQERHRLDYMRATMGFAELFDVIFGSAELSLVKPDPRFFAAVEQALGVQASEILFWDDSAANVEQAHRRGWQAELYQGFADFQRTMTGYVPDWLNEQDTAGVVRDDRA